MLVVNVYAPIVSEPLANLRRSMDAWLHERELILLNLLAPDVTIEVHCLQAVRPPSKGLSLPVKVFQLSCYFLELLHGLTPLLDLFKRRESLRTPLFVQFDVCRGHNRSRCLVELWVVLGSLHLCLD